MLAPYDAEDARGLLKAAIRDPDPVRADTRMSKQQAFKQNVAWSEAAKQGTARTPRSSRSAASSILRCCFVRSARALRAAAAAKQAN